MGENGCTIECWIVNLITTDHGMEINKILTWIHGLIRGTKRRHIFAIYTENRERKRN